MKHCPFCGKVFEPASVVVEDAIDEAQKQAPPEHFWGQVAGGRWLQRMPPTQHLIIFVIVLPALVCWSLVIAVALLCELVGQGFKNIHLMIWKVLGRPLVNLLSKVR